MTIESIKFTELTKSERAVLALDTERWGRMGAGSHLDDWLAYGPGFMIRRRLAMKMAHTNRPVGKLYGDHFAALMKADDLHHMDSTSVSAVLWLYDDPQRIPILVEVRQALSPGQRSRLNSPITARRRIEEILKARASGVVNAKKMSPFSVLRHHLREQERKIAELEQQLAKRADDLVLDLTNDSAADIANAIISHSGEHKTKHIVAAIAARLTQKLQKAG